MDKSKTVNWIEARARFEAGAKIRALAVDYGVTQSAVKMRISREGWRRDDPRKARAKQLIERHIKRAGVTGDVTAGDLVDQVIGLLEAGASLKLAARYTGVSDDALQNWITTDPSIRARAEQAMAMSPTKALEYLNKHAENDWRAAKVILESHPYTREDWQPANKGDQSGRVQVVIQFDRDTTPANITIDGQSLKETP